ncbi:hypothetical protein NLU13_2525 [Sarocladium strictum]|uniref:Uncharacterized protein n=1 Tax=Sarocladium strictum TaxID=5046 RepID=A0AA39GLS4_SARSR|nr:hypothetical protein NLU13_2525 [Sarocladium strictum]
MRSSVFTLLYAGLALVAAQTPGEDLPTLTTAVSTGQEEPSPTETSGGGGGGGGGDGGNGNPPSSSSTPPADVLLRVPELSVDKIELNVDNLQAEINLAAQVAGLVELNAGVQIGVEKVNITIADVRAELDLVIRLGHLAKIVNRTLSSLDLNPLLINVLDTVTDVVGDVIGAVDGLLGSITQGDSTINFLIDNLGNIVQEVTGGAGGAVSTIVGNFKNNMTYTGSQKQLSGGLLERTYEYGELRALVNIVTNAADQVVRAVVVKGGSGGDDGSATETGSATTEPATSATAF